MRRPSRSGEGAWRRGELARLAGCHPETVRFWEREGLLPPVARTGSGHRRYGPEHLHRLRFLVRGRRLGFSLDELRELLKLAERGGSCEEVRLVAGRHLAEVERRIAELARVRARLSALVERCRGGRDPDCAVLAGLFAEGEPEPAAQRRGGSDLR